MPFRHFFTKGNLIALRELALRRTAERVDQQMEVYRRDHAVVRTWPAAETHHGVREHEAAWAAPDSCGAPDGRQSACQMDRCVRASPAASSIAAGRPRPTRADVTPCRATRCGNGHVDGRACRTGAAELRPQPQRDQDHRGKAGSVSLERMALRLRGVGAGPPKRGHRYLRHYRRGG